MMYESLLRDFTVRTRHNLALIEAQKKVGNEVYETTQLINSLLGLLVLPRERMLNEIPDLPVEELYARGWPKFKIVGTAPLQDTLRPLVRALRNAVAHFNVEFASNEHGEIGGVVLTNKAQRSGRIVWRAELPLVDLRRLVECFSDLLLEVRPDEGRAPRP
jgi:hypothetical protein